MAFDLSFGSLGSARDKLASWHDENKLAISRATATAEIGASAFGFGWLHGRYPKMDVFGVDLSLLAGVGLIGLSFLDKKEEGEGGAYGHHLASLGQGALAVYLAKLGADWGDSMNPDSPHYCGMYTPSATAPAQFQPKVPPPAAVKGYDYAHTGFNVSAADIGQMAQRRNWG